MKGKLYAAALAAIALAACSQEEELTSVNQGSSVSPIAFNVTFGEEPGAGTRAEFGGENDYTLMWTAKDKDRMSLFHGMADPSGNIDSKDVAITGVQNAVYEAQSGEGVEGALRFTTQSMVQPGYAVMVYPVDTVFNYTNEGGVYIRIPENQTEASWKQVPFMSEGLCIATYDGGKGDGAGYGKDYEIGMKQVGTLFTLKTVWANDDKVEALADAGEIDPINVTSVALNRPTDKFNTKVQVMMNKQTPHYADDVEGRDAWQYVTVVDYKDAKVGDSDKAKALTTEAVTGLETSEFVLLPQESETTAANDAEVKIYTRYGSVTIDNTKETMWKNDNTNKSKVADMLNEIIETTTAKNTKGKYEGEMVGGHVTRYIDADLATLDMADVHIKNDKWLHDIILVHDAYQKNEEVVLTIDGDETTGVFEMNMSTLEMLKARPEITLKACSVKGESCTTIKLVGGGEIPAIDFLATGIGGPNVKIELAAGETPWTWTDGARELNKVYLLTNYGVINIAETANVSFSNVSSTFEGIVNEGTINISGGVTTLLGVTGDIETLAVTNNGKITVAEGAELRSGKGCTFTNESATATNMATIENSGIIGCTDDGKIYNYGLIQNMVGGVENMVLITANQTENASFAKSYDDDNKFGTILMKSAADNISVSTETNQGFIKYLYKENTYEKTEPCRYNYLIVENHDITFVGAAPELLFLEVKGVSTMPVIKATEKFDSLEGFILNGRANLQEGNTLITPAAYIQGTFYYGGVFNDGEVTPATPVTNATYFGNSSDNCLVKTN